MELQKFLPQYAVHGVYTASMAPEGIMHARKVKACRQVGPASALHSCTTGLLLLQLMSTLLALHRGQEASTVLV